MNDLGFKDVDAYVRTLVSDELENRKKDKAAGDGSGGDDSSEDGAPDTAESDADIADQDKSS